MTLFLRALKRPATACASVTVHTTSSVCTKKLPYIERGTPQFVQVTLAFFSAGLATFALLYCFQPILPLLSKDFNISAVDSSMSLSATTGMLAIGLIFTGPLSDVIGRKSVMVIALMMAGICTIICVFMTSWQGIILMRALIGLSLSGIIAVAMTYLNEEIHPNIVTISMGLFVSGNAMGSMSGRLLTGVLSDFFPWRMIIAIIGVFALLAACMFWRILPTSRHFRAVSLSPKKLAINLKLHWRDPGLPLLFAEAFLIMGSFITLFNYIGYRLLSSPYYFSQVAIGLLSIVYLAGSYSSPKACALIQNYGRSRMLLSSIGLMLLGVIMTVFSSIALIFIGMLLFTAGFYATHAVASCWIGKRARRAKAQASSLYLFFYYVGSSVAGTIGGTFWLNYAWSGIVIFISIMLAIALFIGQKLSMLPENPSY